MATTDDGLVAMQLTGEQARIVVGIERAGAALSMLGVLLILFTFALFKRLRTVPNTFILFASIANIGASTASLIGLSGIAQGSDSPLCRAQAFLLEMFMQSDPWWSFAMAFNVYLVFFHAANPTTFRRHLWIYCLVCFGLPMIPAIVCLFIQSPEKGPVYGDATLWCWIGDSWNSLRIFSYYIPVWVCIFFSAAIYVAVGYQVFHQRNQLRNLTLSNQAKDTASSEVRESADKNLTRHPEIYGTVTTEVQITTDVCETVTSHGDRSPPMTPLGSPMQCPWSDDLFHPAAADGRGSGSSSGRHPLAIEPELGGAGPVPLPPAAAKVAAHNDEGGVPYPYLRGPQQEQGQVVVVHHVPARAAAGSSNAHVSCSHRTPPPAARGARLSVAERARRCCRRFTTKLRHLDPVKLAYLRTSFVFAISVLVTWTPSSINRVYTLIHPARISYGLNIASAAVLPLQGMWNAVIYFSTSWNLLREELARHGERSRWLRPLGSSSRTRLHGSASARRVPGIVVVPGTDHGRGGGGGGGGPPAAGAGVAGSPVGRGTEMGAVPSSPPSGAQPADAGGRPHAADARAGRYDEDDTDSDSLDGTAGGSSLRGNRRRRPAASMGMDVYPRSPPRLGTLRVQKGGQWDA